MKLTALGCYGRLAPDYPSSGFLLDQKLIIDGGTIGSALSDEKMNKIEWLLLTHSHLDHIKEIPFLFLSRVDDKAATMTLAGIPEVLQELKDHILNGSIWPDFTKIGDPPAFEYKPLELEASHVLGPYTVTPVLLNHPVKCSGFIVENDNTGFVYASDTKTTDGIWKMARGKPNVNNVIADITFPNRMADLAEKTGHYTPEMATKDVEKIGRKVKLLASHMHPAYLDEIALDLKKTDIDTVVMEPGKSYER